MRRVLLASAALALIAVPLLTGGSLGNVVGGWLSGQLSLLMLAAAAAVVISSGNVDISSGPVMGLLGMLVLFVMSLLGPGLSSVLAGHLLAVLLAVSVYSAVFLLTRRGVSSLIATMAVFFMAKGASTLIQICMQGVGTVCAAPGGTIRPASSWAIPPEHVMSVIGNPAVSLGIAVVVVGVLYYWRFFTRSGLDHVATGADPRSAFFAQVSASRVYCRAFMLAAALVFFATLVRIHGRTNGGWSANTGWGEELLAIAIAVIGGTRITGGRFDPVALALATFVIYALRDVVINDLGLPSEIASIVFGVMIGFVALLDARSVRWRPT